MWRPAKTSENLKSFFSFSTPPKTDLFHHHPPSSHSLTTTHSKYRQNDHLQSVYPLNNRCTSQNPYPAFLTPPQDILTDDEIISDSYDLKEIDGVVYEADCSRITIGADNIDIGANASAEEAEEGVEDSAKQVIDVVHSFRLNETQFDKKSYLTYLKGMEITRTQNTARRHNIDTQYQAT